MTEKTITISGIECTFRTSAAIPRIYRRVFGRDIFVDIQELTKQYNKSKEESKASTLPIESLETFENVAFIMHRHGDKEQPNNIDEWLEQFDTFDIYLVLPTILELWQSNIETSSIPKKKIER